MADDTPASDAPPATDEHADRDDLVATARRRHGTAGGMLAAGLLGLEQVLGRKPKQDAPVVVAANSQPVDIDADGIVIEVDDEISVVAPPLPRPSEQPARPIGRRTKRRRSA